jgi:hypothetical protein
VGGVTRLYISGIIIIVAVGFFSSSAFAKSSTVYWNEETIKVGLTEKISFAISGKFRYNEDGNYQNVTDLILTYKSPKWLTTGLSYREFFKKGASGWKNENRTHLEVTARFKLANWGLSNRLRFEYRDIEGNKGTYRIRDKFQVKTPWKWTSLKINPYGETELLYTELDAFNEYRLQAGAIMKLAKRISLNSFYMRSTLKADGDWDEYLNVIGTKLIFKF